MDKIDSFKQFVKKNPSLIKFVKNNEMTWQKFYEMYDLYDESDEIWGNYLNKKEEVSEVVKAVGFTDLIGWLKNIDLDSFQNSINSVQRVFGVLQDFGSKETTTTTPTYKPRPIYKHFED